MIAQPPAILQRPCDRLGTSPSSPRGFTLIELLAVMAILAILMAMTLAIISFASKKGADVKSEMAVTAVTTGLKKYFDRYGEYPEPVDNSGSGLNGAVTLYQALNDDGSDQIVGVSGGSSDGKAGADRIIDLVSEGYVAKDGSSYFIKDGYDRPLRYRVYDPNNPDATNNRTYDLWSYGDDTERNNEALWLKNW